MSTRVKLLVRWTEVSNREGTMLKCAVNIPQVDHTQKANRWPKRLWPRASLLKKKTRQKTEQICYDLVTIKLL